MIYFPHTIKDVKQAFTDCPDDMKVVVHYKDNQVDYGQLELVYVNELGQIVGDEANDYQPKSGEMKVWMFSCT